LSDFRDALYVYAKFRCGVAPLKIKTGGYECLLIENIIYFNNNFQINNCIEDEKHVQHIKIASLFFQSCLFVK